VNRDLIPPWLAYAGYGLLNLYALAGLLGSLDPADVVWLAACLLSARATRRYLAYRADRISAELDDPPAELEDAHASQLTRTAA
jgi:hypothetical protein